MESFVVSWVRRAKRKGKQDVLDNYEDETTTFEKMLQKMRSWMKNCTVYFCQLVQLFYFKRKELLLDLTNNEIRECGMMDTDRGPIKYL